jgi:hypothetical protein
MKAVSIFIGIFVGLLLADSLYLDGRSFGQAQIVGRQIAANFGCH